MALYYWVGGTNSWNATATGKWSNLSGNPPFYTTNPGVADDVFFDGFSSPGTVVTLAINTSVRSITFTGFNGCTFTFGGSLTIGAGGLTLGANTTYNTSGTVTTYTVTLNATSTLTSNGKTLPTNLTIGATGTTLTISGDANFQGNLTTASNAHNLKSSAGVPCNLSIGGNISFSNIVFNITDHVTVRGYGTSKTFSCIGGVAQNIRMVFVSGSVYTSGANGSIGSGTHSLTVESGGEFNPVSTHTFLNGGTLTLSGFNASNNSSFFAYIAGTLTLSTDTVIKSFIQIQTTAITINSTGSSKLLLEGNFTSIGFATTFIRRLEFSGTTASNVTATTSSSNNITIQELIINKTSGGSVNFNSSGNFTLFIPGSTTYSWTHTSGTITQGLNCNIIIAGGNATSQFNYSAVSPSQFIFRNLTLRNGVINLNSILIATTLKLDPSGVGLEFKSSATFGFVTEELLVTNTAAAPRTITLKSATTYEINTSLYMINVGGSRITLTASLTFPNPRAIFNLSTSAFSNVESVYPVNIDSSGTGGVLPYTKKLIYSQNGVLTTTINWDNTSEPPPIAPKITVGYTFVN